MPPPAPRLACSLSSAALLRPNAMVLVILKDINDVLRYLSALRIRGNRTLYLGTLLSL
jgi:hypothetical protein